MLTAKAVHGPPFRRIATGALIGLLLLASAASTPSCTAEDIRQEIIYPTIAVVVVLVLLVAAASDVDTVPATAAEFDCAVTNNAAQAFSLWAADRPLGSIAPGQTCYFTLGAGEHELRWLPLEYGADYYDLRASISVPEGRYYYQITLEPESQ